MKNTIKLGLLFAALVLSLFLNRVQAQSEKTAQPRYKDVVVENPNAEPDMKVVSDFVNALTSGDLDKAKSLLAENYKGYGPSPTDSTNIEQTLKSWNENYKIQSNRKVSFVTQTFKVLSGDLKGSWVSLWGDYSFTQDGKNVTFPLQYTARVTNGKIDTDRVYYDRLYIIQALGYKVTAPGNAK
jgi:ketosteroid isomerase-like protein